LQQTIVLYFLLSSILYRPVYINVVLFLLNRHISALNRFDRRGRIICHLQSTESTYNLCAICLLRAFLHQYISLFLDYDDQRNRRFLTLDSCYCVLHLLSFVFFLHVVAFSESFHSRLLPLIYASEILYHFELSLSL